MLTAALSLALAVFLGAVAVVRQLRGGPPAAEDNEPYGDASLYGRRDMEE